jgi:Flp pilus assembly protein TadD
MEKGTPCRLTRTAHRKPSSQKAFGKILCVTGKGMMRGSLQFRLAGALVACAAALTAAPGQAQGSYSPYDESPATALARYVRTLASDPTDFQSLIGAGKAALELGDAQAAGGFFARADEVNPRSPLPQAGMGAVAVANGDAQGALPYFQRAQQLGEPVASFACDRGLAYDLLGQQAKAQADYRLAIGGRDGDEARRRLALSLAISGNRAAALQTLAPLSARGDAGVPRVRAFIFALTGDSSSAMNAINAAMPGSWSRVAPFVQRLPSLSTGQRAAAVNLGIFPDSGQASYAAAPAAPSVDRLADLEALLRVGPAPQPAQPAVQAPARTVQASYVRHVAPAASFQPKIWLQLASGGDDDSLSSEFQRLKSKNPDLFDGLTPYVAQTAGGTRLLVGPFRGRSDAQILSQDFATVGIDVSNFTNSQTDRIAPLAAE